MKQGLILTVLLGALACFAGCESTPGGVIEKGRDVLGFVGHIRVVSRPSGLLKGRRLAGGRSLWLPGLPAERLA